MEKASLQEQCGIADCFGCGTANKNGLAIKSYWEGDEAICAWQPKPYHCGASRDTVCGGVIAALIDCHSVNLAIANAYKNENRLPGSHPILKYVTAQLNVSLMQPSPVDKPLQVRAKIVDTKGRKTWVQCDMVCEGKVCVKGEVLAIRIKEDS
jgi:acyl-coenzyme A thioesterase PaaI-like protein